MRDAASETRLLQQKLSNITSHPFVNFFLELCKSRDGLDLKDLAKKAGRLWEEMDVSEKVPYYRLARKVKKIGKSKKGLDVPRNKRRKRRKMRPKEKPIITQPEHRKIPIDKTRVLSQETKGGPSEEAKKLESANGSSTDCNSVEKYCLDVLKRRKSHSSTYESD